MHLHPIDSSAGTPVPEENRVACLAPPAAGTAWRVLVAGRGRRGVKEPGCADLPLAAPADALVWQDARGGARGRGALLAPQLPLPPILCCHLQRTHK